ncbi:DUF58 domain-containing protein [Methylomagnum sp.]
MLKRLLFHNFTLAHRLSGAFRQRLSPLGHVLLLVAMLAAVFGFDTRSAATYQLFTLLTALFGLSLSWALAGRRWFPVIEAERRLPRHATVGEPLRYTLTLTNTGQRPQRGLWLLDQLSGGPLNWAEFAAAPDPGAPPRNPFDRYVGYYKWRRLVHAKRGASLDEQALPELPPRQAVSVALELTPERRGRLQFAGLRLYRPDPFGLFRTLHSVALPQSCRVLPKRYPVSPLPSGGGRIYQRGGVALANAVGESPEFMALREYRPGDPLRSIHWRSSAKFGRWVAKEYQDEYFVRRALVLDTFCPPARAGDFEAAVSVAASLALAAPERDALLDLMFVEREAHCFTAGRGLADATALLEVLAGVQLSQREDFAVLAHNTLSRAGQLSSVTCVLLDFDAPRRRFCEALAGLGLSVAVLLVREAALEEAPPGGLFLRHVRPGHLATDLSWH